jgi:hypothetical protein
MEVGPIPEQWLRELSRLDRLALEADVDPDALRRYLEREVERRRAEGGAETYLPEVGLDMAPSETAI